MLVLGPLMTYVLKGYRFDNVHGGESQYKSYKALFWSKATMISISIIIVYVSVEFIYQVSNNNISIT